MWKCECLHYWQKRSQSSTTLWLYVRATQTDRMDSAIALHVIVVFLPITMAADQCPAACHCSDREFEQYKEDEYELTRILCSGGSIPSLENLKNDKSPKELVLDAYKTDESFEIRRNDIPTGLNVRHLVVKGGTGTIFHAGAFQNLATSLVSLRVGNQVTFNETLTFLFGLGQLQRLELAHNKQYWTRKPESHVVSLFRNVGLYRLKHIDISYCFIYKMGEGVFTGVENITSLDLSWNRMRKVPRAIRVLLHLQVLDLSFNDIRTLYAGNFKRLKALQKLVLVGNEFGDLDPDTFRGLENTLYNLDLQMTGQSVIPTKALARLKALNVLNISENPFTKMSADSLKGEYCLHRLELHYTNVEFHPDMFHAQRHCIRELSLFKPRIDYFPREPFASLESLSVLEFKGAPMTSILNTSLAGIKASSIDLSYIPLTYIAAGAFSGLNHPLHVTLIGTSITSLHFAQGYPSGTFSKITVEGSLLCDCDTLTALGDLGCTLRGSCLMPNTSSAVGLHSDQLVLQLTKQCQTKYVPLDCVMNTANSIPWDFILIFISFGFISVLYK